MEADLESSATESLPELVEAVMTAFDWETVGVGASAVLEGRLG